MKNVSQATPKNLLTVLFVSLILIWFVLMFVPLGVLMYKLTLYLIEKPFREWYTILLWIFVIPTSTVVVFILKAIKQLEKKI